MERRTFINTSALATVSAFIRKKTKAETSTYNGGLVLSTWKNEKANAAAWNVIKGNGNCLDAVEAGARIPEADPKDVSVGLGGLPDRSGKVTLDACIMDENGNAGSVCYVQNYKHPISIARSVMENTPHVILAGKGAERFAKQQGFKKEKLLTPNSKKSLADWKRESKYAPKINSELHDTIGILAIDKKGNISGACTTSGLGFKLPGRVGDSPIIGAGLFVDNEVGGAAATGLGEAVLKSLGSFLVVELMRNGMSPDEACKEAVMRIVRKQVDFKDFQIGYIAVNKEGEVGSFSIQPGFVFTLNKSTSESSIHNAISYIQE